MKILSIHSDFIEFEVKKKAIQEAEESVEKKNRIENCLVIFCSAEQGDDLGVASQTTKEIIDIAQKVNASKIVLYPFVHLTNKPAPPKVALSILDALQNGLKEYEIHRVPFGWYKGFTIKGKGHPLAELSREISSTSASTSTKPVQGKESSLQMESEIKSKWLILNPDGSTHEIKIAGGKLSGFDFSPHSNLEKFALYELHKIRTVDQEPPHIKLMKRLEIADYEPGSDPGNVRYYPKGRLIKSLLEQWITDRVLVYGAMEVESPIMYDFEHPALKSYLERFPARQYTLESAKKKFFLRFSACFGQFLIAENTMISYRNLPMKIYELTRYSFRLEKAGELVGLRRMRAFTMPDMHTICRDDIEALKEFEEQFKLCMSCLKDLGLDDYETAIRLTEDLYNNNKDFILRLVSLTKKPILIEIWSKRYAYFDPKFEFNFVDASNKASALSTVQIDHENAQRFNIQYTDSDNKRKHPLILHCSPSGAVERCIYAILESAYMKNPKSATFPMWLAPTQIRICPINEEYTKDAEKIALSMTNIRVDVDDRSEGIGKKIRDAELDWVPLIAVLGSKEAKSKKLAVRFRETGLVKQMSIKQIQDFIKKKTDGFPFKNLPLAQMLSKRPIFVG